ANDSDPDGDPISVTLTSDVSNGTLTLDDDGSFTYTPDANFNGTDSFTYQIDDGNGETSTATVTLNVDPVADAVVLDGVTGDDFIDVQEQLSPITISGTADPNGSVTIDFGGTVATTDVGADGRFSQVFQPADIPDANSVQISITSLDANGNDSGSTNRVVSISQPTNELTVNVAGSTTTFLSQPPGFDLNFGDMPDAAFFEINSGVASVRTPSVNSSSEIRFTADDGRTFAFIGSDLDYDGATGIITGVEIGTPTDADFLTGTGFNLTVAEFVTALNNSVVGGVIDNAPLDAFFGEFPWVYNGSDQEDWIDVNEENTSNDIFFGNGGDDEADFGLGDDQYFGGSGNDFFYDTDGNNSFDGGAGELDQISYANASGAVDVNLNAGSAEKSDGTLDLISGIEFVRGSQFSDSIQLADNADFSRALGLAGNDTLRGGAGGFDQVSYDLDSRYTVRTVGVTINIALGFAIDLFGDTDSLAGFESVLTTEYNDVVITGDGGFVTFAGDGNDTVQTGAGDDFTELGAGEDILVYTAGFDVVGDLNPDEDALVFGGFALANFDSLTTAAYDDGVDTGTLLAFDDGAGTTSSIVLFGVTLAEVSDLLNVEYFYGTDLNDTIEHTTVDGDAKITFASFGDDTYIYSNNAPEAYQELRYNAEALDFGSITANLDANAATNTILKSSGGTDTLVDLSQVARWAFGIYGTANDDTFNVTLSNSDFAWIGVFDSGGDDTVNLFGGTGWLRVDAGEDGENVTADLGAGTVSWGTDSTTINFLGDISDVTLNLRTHAGDDNVIGSEGRDSIILGPGTDVADGRGGFDSIQYNRFDIFEGVTVNLATGIATGIWDGQAFTHTLSNFERVRGSAFDDYLTASETGSHLQGHAGNNTLIGGSGRDTLWGWEGDELFDSSAGSTETQGYGDLIEPWSGSDTIIGHQAHWEAGEGIEIGYWNLTGTGGLQVTLGLEGSGTVTSNNVGVVNDTFTYANWLRATDENDYFVGAESYGAPNEGFTLRGGGGDDTIIGGGGRENMRGGDGDDLLDASGGSIENQFWGDYIQPGAGNNTIIGHQQLWEQGDGIDISYDDVEGSGGVVVNVGANGSGTVVSNNAGVVNDTFTYTHYFGGTSDADVFNGSDHQSEGYQPFGGNDTINGGDGEDQLNYRWDIDRGGTGAVTVNLQTGIATDPFGDTDTFTSIESVRGTEEGDTIIGSVNDEGFRLEAGADSLTYNGGYDYVGDFDVTEDTLQFAGAPITYIGTLEIVSRSSGPGHSFRFDDDFDDRLENEFELTLDGVSLEGMYQILAGMTFTPVNTVGTFGRADYFGSPADDTISIGGNDREGEFIYASAGNDTYNYSASTNETFTDLIYEYLGAVGITVDLDMSRGINTVDKGVAGVDTLEDIALAAAGDGLFIVGSDGDDLFNIRQDPVEDTWLGISHRSGHDVINLTAGTGLFRVDLGSGNDDVTGDLVTGFFSEGPNESVTINYSGDLSNSRLDVRTRNGNDTVYGSDFDNRFILGAGNDFADARGGWDTIRYDRNGVEQGVTVNLATGVATGVWDNQAFTHTLVNFEQIRGTNFDDVLVANNLGNRLDGRDGDDILIGGAENDELSTTGGVSVLIGGGGDDYYNVYEGNNLIIFSAGNDYIDGFDSTTDMLQWDTSIAALPFTISEYVFDGDTRVRFDFDDGSGNFFGVDLGGTTLVEANQIVANMTNQANYIIGTTGRDDEIFGTIGDDDINLLGNNDEGDFIYGSEGNDTLRFTHATDNSWYEVDYSDLSTTSVTLNLNLQNNTGSVDKGAAGIDTLVDPQFADWGLSFQGTSGNDTFNVTLNSTEFNWISFGASGGTDTLNLAGGNGLVRASIYSGDVSADLSQIHLGASGSMYSTTGEAHIINAAGDLTNTLIELRTEDGDDNLVGSEYNDRFILGTGTDSADGLGGIDQIRYDRSGVESGVTVDLQEGSATGTWDGRTFNHTLQNIEVVRGSDFDDQLTALDDGFSELRGRDGDDLLIRSDFAEDWTEGGEGRDTLMQSSSGSFDFSAFNVRDHYRDIEVLNFENAGADDITLSLDNVMDLSDTADSLLEGFFGSDAVESITVLGEAGDRLTFDDEGFSKGSSISDGEGRTLDIYQYDGGAGILAIVAVDQDVSVEGAATNT
ncbi:cadherin-like domain-containing protein, partial [Shimia sp. R9_1]|nr:cadherin-like domain-containing protein [Shimia sp. R9_1]